MLGLLTSNLPRSLSANPQTSANIWWTPASAPIILPPLTGSGPFIRPRCKTCPIHPPASSFTSSCTNLTYPITTHADCKSITLIYQLQCTVCNAFHIGETRRSLSLTAWMDTVSPLQFRTQTYQLPPTPNPIRFHFKIAGLLASYTNYLIPPLTTFAASLKLHTNLFPKHNTLQA